MKKNLMKFGAVALTVVAANLLAQDRKLNPVFPGPDVQANTNASGARDSGRGVTTTNGLEQGAPPRDVGIESGAGKAREHQVGDGPAVGDAPSVGKAPGVGDAPSVGNAPSVGKAPSVGEAPKSR